MSYPPAFVETTTFCSCIVATHVSLSQTLSRREKPLRSPSQFFNKIICAHSTNIKEIYCDLDTANHNEIVSTLLNSLGIKVKV